MDEHDSHLRMATTVELNSYTLHKDETHGWENASDFEEKNTNVLYILDEQMKITGMITGIAEEERIYSVKFMGETGCFVTFKQVDPLFAVDLCDPPNPRILSELKIPGFSQYMHPFGDGLLFGIGMSADERTGRIEGIKISSTLPILLISVKSM